MESVEGESQAKEGEGKEGGWHWGREGRGWTLIGGDDEMTGEREVRGER